MCRDLGIAFGEADAFRDAGTDDLGATVSRETHDAKPDPIDHADEVGWQDTLARAVVRSRLSEPAASTGRCSPATA